MSCLWLENRKSKDFKKTAKYSQLTLELTNRYPENKVNQYNIILDVLGVCSKEVEQNIKELVGDNSESVMRQLQKSILSKQGIRSPVSSDRIAGLAVYPSRLSIF